MAIEVKPPQPLSKEDYKSHLLFLAGSIEMGVAELWQDRVMEKLKDIPNLVVMNPRRDNWDSSWKQEIENPVFAQQVNWELDNIKNADTVIFYFDPNTKSPITLMELGIISERPWQNVIVCCPEGFWRKGNVDILVSRMNKHQNLMKVSTLEKLLDGANTYVVNRMLQNHFLNVDFDNKS